MEPDEFMKKMQEGMKAMEPNRAMKIMAEGHVCSEFRGHNT